MPNPLPKGVTSKCEGLAAPYALVVWLDGRDAFIEFTEDTHAAFITRLNAWRRNGRDGLDPARCDVRFFVRSPAGIKELSK